MNRKTNPMIRQIRQLVVFGILAAVSAQAQVPTHRLFAEYEAGGVGAGVDTDALLGEYALSVTLNGTGDSLVVMHQDAANTENRLAIAISDVRASTDLSDFPNTLTAGDYLKVNPGGTGFGLVDEPANTNTIPHVGQLPAATATSPDLIYLTHDYEEGPRDDATVTVGFHGINEAGYSDGTIVLDDYGAISDASPLALIGGRGTSASYSLTGMGSHNEGWIAEFDSVIIEDNACSLGDVTQDLGARWRPFEFCTTAQNLVSATVDINFKRDDGTYYFTGGSVIDEAGLYEKVGSPLAYHDLAPIEDSHRLGQGTAACGENDPPTAAAQVCIDDRGRAYFSLPRTSIVSTDPAITFGATSNPNFEPGISVTDLETSGQNAEFTYIPDTQIFYQRQGTVVRAVTWTEAWQYVVSVTDTPTNRAFLTSVFMGVFVTHGEAAFDRDGYTDGSVDYYYMLDGFNTLLEVETFTASTRTTINEGFAWRGPVVISSQVLDILLDKVTINPTEAASETATKIEFNGTVYSISGTTDHDIVLPDASTGILRDPTAADFNTMTGRSRVVGFDGVHLLIVSRRLEGMHGSSADFNEVSEGSNIANTSHRWRGYHYQDYLLTGNLVDDVYFNRHNGWRVYTGSEWVGSTADFVFGNSNVFLGDFADEDAALGAATGNGQFCTFGGNLYRVANYDAASSGFYVYFWTEVNRDLIREAPNLRTLPGDFADEDYNGLYIERNADGANLNPPFYKQALSDSVVHMVAGIDSAFGQPHIGRWFAVVGGTNRDIGMLSPTIPSLLIWEQVTTTARTVNITYDANTAYDLIDHALFRLRFREYGTDDWTDRELTRIALRDYRYTDTGTRTQNQLDDIYESGVGEFFRAGRTYQINLQGRATSSDPWVSLHINPEEAVNVQLLAHGNATHLSDDRPQRLTGHSDSNPGTSLLASRADHSHGRPRIQFHTQDLGQHSFWRDTGIFIGSNSAVIVFSSIGANDNARNGVVNMEVWWNVTERPSGDMGIDSGEGWCIDDDEHLCFGRTTQDHLSVGKTSGSSTSHVTIISFE